MNPDFFLNLVMISDIPVKPDSTLQDCTQLKWIITSLFGFLGMIIGLWVKRLWDKQKYKIEEEVENGIEPIQSCIAQILYYYDDYFMKEGIDSPIPVKIVEYSINFLRIKHYFVEDDSDKDYLSMVLRKTINPLQTSIDLDFKEKKVPIPILFNTVKGKHYVKLILESKEILLECNEILYNLKEYIRFDSIFSEALSMIRSMIRLNRKRKQGFEVCKNRLKEIYTSLPK